MVTGSVVMVPHLLVTISGEVCGTKGRLIADGHDHRVRRDDKLAALDRNRPTPTRGVGLAQFHAQTLHAGHPFLRIGDDPHQVGQQVENYTFLLRVMHLFGAGRHFGLAAAIDNCRLGSEAQGRAGRVHGHVAAAHGHRRWGRMGEAGKTGKSMARIRLARVRNSLAEKTPMAFSLGMPRKPATRLRWR